MGAPGTSYWTGSVLVFNTSSGGSSVYLDDDSGAVGFGSYLGKLYTCCYFYQYTIVQPLFVYNFFQQYTHSFCGCIHQQL